jgi:hypothetical protein
VNKLGYKIYSPYICNEFKSNQNGKAIIRIEEEIKALRIEIQSVWEITLDSVLSILRAKLSGLEQALVICNEVNDFVDQPETKRNGLKR